MVVDMSKWDQYDFKKKIKKHSVEADITDNIVWNYTPAQDINVCNAIRHSGMELGEMP